MALYDDIGRTYAHRRRPDPRIAAAILAALGDAETIANIGAGAGSYEPPGRTLVAVEPSKTMIAQRPPGAAPCLQGVAEALPLKTACVDAAMAILTIHHWPDQEAGLREMARIARRRVVLLTWVPDADPFWLTEDYFPEIMAHDRTVFPDSASLTALLERAMGRAILLPLPIPHDCVDGFLCAYWRRPVAYLDSAVRAGISSFARIDPSEGLARLRADLDSGRWTERHGDLLGRQAMDLGYRIAVCDIATR